MNLGDIMNFAGIVCIFIAFYLMLDMLIGSAKYVKTQNKNDRIEEFMYDMITDFCRDNNINYRESDDIIEIAYSVVRDCTRYTRLNKYQGIDLYQLFAECIYAAIGMGHYDGRLDVAAVVIFNDYFHEYPYINESNNVEKHYNEIKKSIEDGCKNFKNHI